MARGNVRRTAIAGPSANTPHAVPNTSSTITDVANQFARSHSGAKGGGGIERTNAPPVIPDRGGWITVPGKYGNTSRTPGQTSGGITPPVIHRPEPLALR